MDKLISNVFQDEGESERICGILKSSGFSTLEDLNCFASVRDIIDMTKLEYEAANKLFCGIKYGAREMTFYQIRPNRPIEIDLTTRKILFVGPIGSGKTSLISNMYNFLLEKKLEHTARYRLDDCHTTEPQSYYTQRVGHPVLLIDTPGLSGDAREDNATIEQIKKTVEHEKEIHAICVVVKATETRATSSLVYLVRTIIKEFGCAPENAFVFYTFSDGGALLMQETVEELGLYESAHYQVNNSGLYAPTNDPMVKASWELSTRNFFEFFGKLAGTNPFRPKFVPSSRSVCNKCFCFAITLGVCFVVGVVLTAVLISNRKS